MALPSKSHVYDVRARKALGHTDRVACALPLGGAALYALLPYRVEGVELRGPREAKAGQSHRVSCVVRGSAPPSDHVLHLDVRRPDGTRAGHYSLNLVARGGRAEAEIPFALNDPPGRWTLVARDVASGARAETAVEVKPQ